jgi:hypothetical protein
MNSCLEGSEVHLTNEKLTNCTEQDFMLGIFQLPFSESTQERERTTPAGNQAEAATVVQKGDVACGSQSAA